MIVALLAHSDLDAYVLKIILKTLFLTLLDLSQTIPPSAITAISVGPNSDVDPTIVEVVPIILATRPANCVILPIGADVVTPANPRVETRVISPVGKIFIVPNAPSNPTLRSIPPA